MDIYKQHDKERGIELGLLPCPFCGGEPGVKYIGNDHTKKRSIEVYCLKCRIKRRDSAIKHYGFDWLKAAAIKEWNERVEDDRLHDAAPDLLAACKAARLWFGDRPDESDPDKWGMHYAAKRTLIDLLDEAIAKAEPEPEPPRTPGLGAFDRDWSGLTIKDKRKGQ